MSALTAGIHYDVPEAVYHADPCPAPSLSHGIARLLLQSPRKAWHAHPRLNTAREDDNPTPAKDDGTILHALLLGTGRRIVDIDADSFQTKAAKAERDEARAAGAVPVLAWHLAELERCAEACRDQLAQHREARDALTDGKPEVTVIWQEHGIWCRARPDWLQDHPAGWVDDLKFTGLSAAPEDWQRTLERDYATQAAWYLRGLRANGRRPRGFRFIATETKPPHDMAVYACAPSLLATADADMDEAVQRWAHCLKTDSWPGYPDRTMHVEASPWRINKAEERRAAADDLAALNQGLAA